MIGTLRVKQLKLVLDHLGCGMGDAVEKSDLVQRILKFRPKVAVPVS